MARVFVDPNSFSTEWFPAVLDELIKSRKVTFLFSNCEKGIREVQKVTKALAFMQLMFKAKKAVHADRDRVEQTIREIENHPAFTGCKNCNDGHIFAAIFLHPTRYVFSTDKRMAECRSKISGKVDKRFCQFIVLSSHELYIVHRGQIV